MSNKNIIEKRRTVLGDISPLDTKALIINSRAVRSPIFESMARFKRFLAVSAGLFLT